MRTFGNTLIVAPVEPIERGREFDQYEPLPLHITIQPWFLLPQPDGAFMNAFVNYMFDQRPIVAQKGSEAVFNGGKHVDIVKSIGGLETLHADIGELITKYGGLLNPSVTERPFRPHVTRVNGRQAGDEIVIHSLQFVHRQDDGSKLTGKSYSLGNRK